MRPSFYDLLGLRHNGWHQRQALSWLEQHLPVAHVPRLISPGTWSGNDLQTHTSLG